MTEIHSIQDFNLLKSNIEKITQYYWKEFNFTEESIWFIIFFLERFYALQDDEIENSITDWIFVTRQKKYENLKDYPHDRWIDAIIINEEEKIIDIFNFKYKKQFKDLKKFFESNEIDKVLWFLKNIFERDSKAFINSNPIIKEKVSEIEFLQDKKYIKFKFKIHFVSNIYNGFTKDEEERLNNEIRKFKWAVEYDYILLPDIVNELSSTEKNINWKFRAIDNRFFEKSWYWYKALVVEIKGEDIIRLTLDNSDLRNNCDVSIDEIVWVNIKEEAFEDNVRIYLKQKTNINAWIKMTALDKEESLRFFFFNNGITITCNKIDQWHSTNSPIIWLEWLQIVNWWQTIHSLKEALDEDPSNFRNISVLCRIYETTDKTFKSNIAQYTNNQNAVNDRDIRSIDVYQIKLEEELKLKLYFYERKKNQYENEDRLKRIDAEKLWQAMLALYLEMPMEAKNRKKIIFSEKYNELFNSELTAEKALLAFKLYSFVEEKKKKFKKRKEYLSHASYYIIFFMKILTWTNKELEDYTDNYNLSLEKIEIIIEKEKDRLWDKYFDAHLFKSNRPKGYLSELKL